MFSSLNMSVVLANNSTNLRGGGRGGILDLIDMSVVLANNSSMLANYRCVCFERVGHVSKETQYSVKRDLVTDVSALRELGKLYDVFNIYVLYISVISLSRFRSNVKSLMCLLHELERKITKSFTKLVSRSKNKFKNYEVITSSNLENKIVKVVTRGALGRALA